MILVYIPSVPSVCTKTRISNISFIYADMTTILFFNSKPITPTGLSALTLPQKRTKTMPAKYLPLIFPLIHYPSLMWKFVITVVMWNCWLVHWHLFTSSTDFLSAWMCMTLSAHSIMVSPRGTLTRSCLRRPTRNSPGSSRLTVVDGRVRSMVASLRFWSHTIALCTHLMQNHHKVNLESFKILSNFIHPIQFWILFIIVIKSSSIRTNKTSISSKI